MVQVRIPIGDGRQQKLPMGSVAGKKFEIVGSHGFAANDLPDVLYPVKSGKLPVKKIIEMEINLIDGLEALMVMDYESPLGMTIINRFDYSSRL